MTLIHIYIWIVDQENEIELVVQNRRISAPVRSPTKVYVTLLLLDGGSNTMLMCKVK